MDLYCRICKEPWDNDSLHEAAEASERTYDEVAADFRQRGCKALDNGSRCEPTDPDTQAAIGTVYDLLGDDMDGAASTFDDLGL